MMSELEITALRNDLAQELFVLDGAAPPDQDEGDDGVVEDRRARAARCRFGVDLLTAVLRGA